MIEIITKLRNFMLLEFLCFKDGGRTLKIDFFFLCRVIIFMFAEFFPLIVLRINYILRKIFETFQRKIFKYLGIWWNSCLAISYISITHWAVLTIFLVSWKISLCVESLQGNSISSIFYYLSILKRILKFPLKISHPSHKNRIQHPIYSLEIPTN